MTELEQRQEDELQLLKIDMQMLHDVTSMLFMKLEEKKIINTSAPFNMEAINDFFKYKEEKKDER